MSKSDILILFKYVPVCCLHIKNSEKMKTKILKAAIADW